jgi:hypothetical protein
MITSGRFEKIVVWSRSLSPVTLTFCLSLILSAIAYINDPVINRDGILYIDTARIFLEEGVSRTIKHFDWPWFSMLIGASHWLIGFPLELWARIWCALFMAGTCSLIVATVRTHLPEAGRWACLVTLAIPACNKFRSEVLREFGFWFFCMLALWLVQRWRARPGWYAAALVHLAVAAAAAFRLEAVVLVPALVLWQVAESMRSRNWRGCLQFNVLPLFGFALGVVWVLVAGEGMHGRIVRYLQLIDPMPVIAEFREISAKFGAAVINKFSRDDAGGILFFGVLAAVLLKFAKLLGPFLVPLLFRGGRREARSHLQNYRPSLWIWLFYFVMIVLFFIRRQYFLGRWVSFLDLLFVPLAVAGLVWLFENHRKLTMILVVISIVVTFDNVISLSAKKTHYIAAGKWISANIGEGEKIFYDDPRISYYAGRGFPRRQVKRALVLKPEYAGQYRYYVFESRSGDPAFQQWLQQQHKRVLAEFTNRKGRNVQVIGD